MTPKDFADVITRKKEKVVFAQKLGKHLQKKRCEKKISQAKLSLSAGYFHTYVNKIENGNYSPSMHTIWRLVHKLGLNLADFFKDFAILLTLIKTISSDQLS